MQTVWTFRSGRITVSLKLEQEQNYEYDGHDPDGETQAALDRGDYIAFSSVVTVERDGEEIGWDALGGSVYALGEVHEFWTAHRDPDPMNRNCSIRGEPVAVICHYFPDMVRIAVAMARETLGRKAAA